MRTLLLLTPTWTPSPSPHPSTSPSTSRNWQTTAMLTTSE
ncbi:hypothetical protein E2C01_086468 [Portunus trituberculatus]|uniref:Uncharacterized protein n=1 Tax=Portunus trituberculatus TaxID=210409 RepID=A0A5B7J5H1_PORTR|nr:hypothetical protein [Portunus trituberculatus]